ncbi:hypothetical protein GGF31_000495 [Allomyces arbusculus]|nr:hypothetical protein GGF31_000495 [Allomyces arbusculus]
MAVDVPHHKQRVFGPVGRVGQVDPRSQSPIPFTSWGAPAVALAFVHIYSGWTPNAPSLPEDVPEDLVIDFSCDPGTLDEDAWRHLLKLARFLGLKSLALAVNRNLVALIEEQYSELPGMPDDHVDVRWKL